MNSRRNWKTIGRVKSFDMRKFSEKEKPSRYSGKILAGVFGYLCV